MARKALLSYNELITKMEDIGIQFNTITKPEAKKLLQERNYYYKISSFRKLFPKDKGKYNIEFATLADIAVLDMQLRYFLLDICLDVEHSIKTVLMDAITKNPNIDGYNIVKDYAVYNPQGYNNTVTALSKNAYLKNMYLKHHKEIPIWVLMETMDFGNVCYFVNMYCQTYPKNKKLKKANNLCQFARHIRNACAHSNVLLVDMLQNIITPSIRISNLAEQINLNRQDLKYRKIHDIFALISLHKEYCSPQLQKHRQKEAIKIAKRAKKHPNYYKNNHNIVFIYKKIIQIVVKHNEK